MRSELEASRAERDEAAPSTVTVGDPAVTFGSRRTPSPAAQRRSASASAAPSGAAVSSADARTRARRTREMHLSPRATSRARREHRIGHPVKLAAIILARVGRRVARSGARRGLETLREVRACWAVRPRAIRSSVPLSRRLVAYSSRCSRARRPPPNAPPTLPVLGRHPSARPAPMEFITTCAVVVAGLVPTPVGWCASSRKGRSDSSSCCLASPSTSASPLSACLRSVLLPVFWRARWR